MANSVSLTNRVDLVVDSLYVFDDEGRINIPFEIKKRATIDYVNEIRDDLKNDPNITGTLTTDNLIANDDITTKGSLKVDTITAFEAPQININNNVVVSGSLIVGTSNIINALGTKANQITTYTKDETNQQIANVVNGAPELLNTLVELSQAINNDQNFATSIATELSTKATNTRVNEIRDTLQTSINSTNTNLSNNYYNRDTIDLSNTSLQNQITADVTNLSTNYNTKTEITNIKTILNNTDTSLQNQITADVNNLSTNYYTKTEVEAIKTTLNNTDTALQNIDTSLQNQITADVNNLSTNYFNKTDVDNKLILKENITDNNDKLFLKANKSDVYLKEETLTTQQFYDNLQAGLATRQTILLAGLPLNGEALLNGRTLKGVTVNAPLSLSSNSSSITISSNTYSKEEINTALALKSDSTNITDALALKENITNNDAKLLLKADKTYVDDKLTLKADITYTDSLNNLKADKTYVDNQLALKESITNNDAKLILKESIINNDAKLILKESIINNDAKLVLKESIINNDAKLNLKANKIYVDDQLALKENITTNDAKLALKESIINNDAKLLLKANKIYVDDQLALKESITSNDAKLLLKESITANDAKLALKESIINNDAKLLLKANKVYVDDQLTLKESIINNDAKLVLKESIINNDAKLALKESLIDNDAKLLLKANKIYVDDQLALKESITANDAKLLLKESIINNDAKLLLKESIVNNDAKLLLKESIINNDAKLLLKESIINNDAKLLLKESIINNDAKLLLKESITANDAKLLLKANKTYVDEQLATKETIINNNTKLSLKADISYVDTLGTNLTYSINAGALNLSTNYYNKTSIDAIKTGIDVSLSNKADKSDTYTKAQVNTIQNNLATSLNNTNDYLNSTIDDLDDNYYTKTEINTGYYSKTEIDTTISNLIDSSPTNLDTLKEIATALNNDPNMYTTIQTQLAGKQNKFLLGELPATNSGRLFDLNSTKFRGIHCSNPLSIVQTNDAYLTLDADCYTKAQTDSLINVKSDNTYTDAQLLLKENIIDNDIKLALKENITTNNTKLAGKQNKFLIGELPATNSGRLFDLNSSKFRGIHCSNPLSIVQTNDAYLTLDADCYTKSQTDSLINAINNTPTETQLNLKADKTYTDEQLALKENISDNNIKLALKANITYTDGQLALKENITNNDIKLNLKADKTYVDNQLALKENISDNDVKLALKADKTYTDNQLALKESITNNDIKLALKENISDNNTKLTLKADKTYTDTQLALKANITYTDAQLALKESITNNDVKLALKADKTYTDTQLALKADKTYTDDQLALKESITNNDIKLALKADKTYTDDKLALKESITNNDVKLALKADKTYTDTELALKESIINNDAKLNLKADKLTTYTKTESDANYYYKSFIDNTACAWSSGLASDARHFLSTGTNDLTIRSNTGIPFDIMRIYNSGFVNFTSNVMFDAEPQDITFLSSGAYYTLQSRFDLKQNSLTASTPASSTQLLDGTTLKALKAGTNITLTNDATSVTINGPVVSGFQNTLTAATATGAHPILNGTTIKCLKAGTNITMVSDGTSVTVNNGLDAYTKTEVTNSLALKANAANPVFTGNASVGGNLTVNNGSITAGIDSSIYNSNDRLETAFSLNNNKVNGFSTYYMNSTTVLGQITQTGKLFTGQGGMELLSITNHPLRIGSGASQIPQIELLATGTRDVIIKTPLQVNSSMSVDGISNWGNDMTITKSAYLDSATFRVTNTNDGYSSIFVNTTNSGEEGQIWTGRGYGLNVRTNTNSNITFQTGGYASPNSMSILGSGNRDVEIYTPLKTTGNATIGGTLTVTGALTTTAFYSAKFYCALLVINNLMSATVFPGFVQSGVSLNKSATGTYTITMPAHPRGTQYMVMVQARATSGTTPFFYIANVTSSTQFTVYSKSLTNAFTDSDFYFHTVP